jgi:hypothetical protein
MHAGGECCGLGLYSYVRRILLISSLVSLVWAPLVQAVPNNDPAAGKCAAFHAWKDANKNKAIAVTELANGVELAKERRHELKTLIMRNPRAALSWAVPGTEKKELPAEVAGQLEDDIVGDGYVGLLMAARLNDTNAVPSASLTVNGQVLRLFLHGNQFARRQWWKVPVKGIAIDGLAVVEDDSPVSAPPPPRVLKTRTVVRTYDPEQVKVSSKGGFDAVGLKELEFLEDEPGTPWLPAEIINVALPSGAEVRGLKVQFNEKKIRDGRVPPPVQPPVPTMPDVDIR